jgi:hypothetical protein
MRGRGRDRPGSVSIDGIKVVVYGVDAGLLVEWDGMGRRCSRRRRRTMRAMRRGREKQDLLQLRL